MRRHALPVENLKKKKTYTFIYLVCVHVCRGTPVEVKGYSQELSLSFIAVTEHHERKGSCALYILNHGLLGEVREGAHGA